MMTGSDSSGFQAPRGEENPLDSEIPGYVPGKTPDLGYGYFTRLAASLGFMASNELEAACNQAG